MGATLPWTSAELEEGSEIDSFTVEYIAGKRKWRGSFNAIQVDWRGRKTLSCPLKEINEHAPGEEMTITLPGGEEMKFCWCPPGSFIMGSPESEDGHMGDEKQHRVTLTKGFWMGKYEVTQRQWESVMGKNPSTCRGWFNRNGNHPVETVTWNDCQEFVQKINSAGSATVSLPTEAQWEYACRAGTSTPFNFGTALNGDKANCRGICPYGTMKEGRFLDETAPVGSYAPNDWGLYDMHGNVNEWCQDVYNDDYYANSPAEDPCCLASGRVLGLVAELTRVVRGGCYGWAAHCCRSAYRHHGPPSCVNTNFGLRLVCSLP